MPPDRGHLDALADDSHRVREQARDLRAVSDRLLEHIAELRNLEREARKHAVGSAEFERLSQEITDVAHTVFRLSATQEGLAAKARSSRTIDETPPPAETDHRPAD